MLNCAIILIIIIGNIFLECDLSWLTICKGKYDFFFKLLHPHDPKSPTTAWTLLILLDISAQHFVVFWHVFLFSAALPADV